MLLLPEVTCPWRASRRVRHAAPAACLSALPGRIPGFGTSPWDDHDTITTYTAVICWQDRSNTAGQIARVLPGQQAISTTAEIQRCPGPTPRKSALVVLGIAAASPALASADMLVCSPGTNGGTLVKGVCVLPSGNVGQPYEAFILTSSNTGGTFSIVSGSLPPGLFMPASFGAAGTIVGGTPTQPGTFPFTVAGVDNAGHQLRQAYSITINPALPLTIVLPAGGSTLPNRTARG